MIALLATSTVALAQRTSQDYVVTTAGDTLRGNLLLVGKDVVKLRQAGSSRMFGPTEISSYGDKKGVIGRSQIVSAHGKSQFVTPLVAGPVSLYSGINAQGDKRFFLQVPDTAYLVEIPPQTAQLTFHRLLSGCSNITFGTNQSMRRYPIKYQGLTKLVLDYNICTKPEQPSRLVKSAVGLRMTYGIKAGLNTADFYLLFDPNPAKQEQSTGYQSGIFLQLSNKTRTSLILEATYQTLQSMYRPGTLPDPSGNARSLSVEYSQLQVPLLLRYTVGNGVIRPFINSGFLYSKNLSNKSVEIYQNQSMPSNTTRRPVINPQNTGYGLAAGVGVVVKRNSLPALSLEMRYERMRYGNYVYYTPQHTALRFDVGVAF